MVCKNMQNFRKVTVVCGFRYQNNISKYDKNKWESSVNHRTINGYGKANKQKPDLIDVDTLVKGKTFWIHKKIV